MNTHHGHLKPATIAKIINEEQAPTNTSLEGQEKSLRDCANLLIRNGKDFGYPHMVTKGERILARIHLNRFKRRLRRLAETESLNTSLLSNRREWFIQQIEEKRNNEHNSI